MRLPLSILMSLTLLLGACAEEAADESPLTGPDVPAVAILELSGDLAAEIDASGPALTEVMGPDVAVGPGALSMSRERLSDGLAHALELLQRPIQPYYLHPGQAGRLKQNFHVYTRLGRLGRGWPSAPQSEADRLVGAVLSKLDRGPSALLDLYETVKPLLPLVLTKAEYASGPLSLYVDTLLRTHDEIFGAPRWEDVFAAIDVALQEPRDPSTYCTPLQCGTFIRELADRETLESLYTGCGTPSGSDYDEYCSYRNAYWFYGFWYRRHAEGNRAAVRAILEDLRTTWGSTVAGR